MVTNLKQRWSLKTKLAQVLHLGHNQSGHNGYQRIYAAIKHVYYWKGMRKHVLVHCKNCPACAKQKVQKTQFEKQIFEPGVQPMEFICIDLIGEFYPPSSKGNRYALTAVCMLTGFTFCIPIKNKTAQEVVTAWRNHISVPFGVCRKLLMDNGTEFKNELFSQVANPPKLQEFKLLEEKDIHQVIMSLKTKTCELDPVPTTIFKMMLPAILPLITKIVNLSLCQGQFIQAWKTAIVRPLIKKAGLQLIMSNF